MNKKQIISLADTIRFANKNPDTVFTKGQIEILADFCKENNPAFKRDRFIDYIDGFCGPNGGAR